MDIALCRCGVDMTEHDDVDGHEFVAAGTRHRCGVLTPEGWLCPRPAYHLEENVGHGPLTGEVLW